ncbi:MAG: hypothetical protein JSU69_08155 [Candidatus Zixiibacteriota bacterium]|nr:MAG: hypothetical protein JSU69_08155 [candidate division Zixibacteria bacterium]
MEEKKRPIVRRREKKAGLAQSFLMKYGLKIVLGFVVVVAFLTLVQCSIEKPEMPTWTSDFTIPAVNRTYLMPEIIRKIDQPGLTIDSTGEVVFSFTKTLDTISISKDLSTDENTRTILNTIGQVTITPDDPTPAVVNLDDYVTLSLDTIPPCSFDILNDMPPIDGFSWVDIESGAIYVKIANNFDLDLDTIIVEIIDLVFLAPISTVQFPPPGIPAGVTDSIAVGLGGKTISNHIRLQIHCHTPGASMLSLSDKSLSSTVGFGDGLTVSAAEAEVPQISKSFSETAELPISHTVISAEIDTGNVSLTLDNGTNLPVDLNLTLPDFMYGGSPFTRITTLQPNSSETLTVDMNGYIFEPADQTTPQEVSIDIFAFIDSTSPNMVVIDEEDSLKITASISTLHFASLTGIVDSTEADFDSISVDLDLPKGFDSVQLVSATLLLEIENAVGLPGFLDLNVEGDGGQLLGLSGPVPPGTVSDPSVATFVNSDLADFLNPVPDEVTVYGNAIFGDGSIGTVTIDDYVIPQITITAPLELVIMQSTFAGDTVSEDIDQDDIDMVTEHVVQARFVSTIINHLPLGVVADIYVDSDPSRLNAQDAQVVISSIQVDQGVIGLDGSVAEATESQVTFVLDSADLQVLENEQIYSSQLITILDSQGQAVKVSGSDYLTVQGFIEIEYRFEED